MIHFVKGYFYNNSYLAIIDSHLWLFVCYYMIFNLRFEC